jgi:hypothetical protein
MTALKNTAAPSGTGTTPSVTETALTGTGKAHLWNSSIRYKNIFSRDVNSTTSPRNNSTGL